MTISRRALPGTWVVLLVLLVTGTGPGAAASEESPLFASNETLTASLELPLRELRRNKASDVAMEGRFGYTVDGVERVFPVTVSVRGHSRRELCTTPPLKLDFPRSQLAGSLLEGQNRLKLVTHCQSGSSFSRYLDHEFAIYRMYATLTDAAFRVRRLELSYRDADRPGRVKTYPAFLIESDREVAARLGLAEVERSELGDADMDPDAVTRLGLFQYLIGNTDWSLRRGRGGAPCCHNGLLLQQPSGRHIIVPYDFDQAGLVDADYALPARGLGLRSVRQRLFRGLCTGEERIEGVIATMNLRREVLESFFPPEGSRKRANRRARDYIDGFYEIVNDPESLRERVLDQCRGKASAFVSSPP